MRGGSALPFVAFVCCVLATAGAAAQDHSALTNLYQEGNALFRQANETVGSNAPAARDLYKAALMRFEMIVRQGGIENGKLYYNIGNAYFRTEDIGRAILNYRRAAQYIPNDPNLHQNLEYARARRLDKIEERQRTRVLKTLFFWHYDIPARARAVIFASCFVIAWALFLLRLFRRRRAWPVWIGATAAILAALMLASLAVDSVAMRRTHPGVVVSRQVTARKGDGEAFEPSFTEPLHAGAELLLLKKRGEWCLVELADGRQCWLPEKSIELVR